MLLANPYLPDPRVLKEARSLQGHGYEITVLAWDREERFPPVEDHRGIRIERIRVRSKYDRKLGQLPKIFLLWCRMILIGRTKDIDIIHCHDLDTLLPGIVLKLLLKKPLVYDAHENYALVKSVSLPIFFVRMLRMAEKLLLKKADAIFTASSFVGREFRPLTRRPVTTIGNYWPLDVCDHISPEEVAGERKRLGISPGQLTIVYIGGLKRTRKIAPLLQAVRDGMGIHLVVCGAGEQQDMVEQEARRKSCVSYLDWVPLDRVPLYSRLSDVVYYGLEKYPGALYNSPNALFLALATGRAMLATDIGDLGEIVRRERCGIVMKRCDQEEVLAALQRLQNRSFLRSLQKNALCAARERYNWDHAEKLLLRTYRRLLQPERVSDVALEADAASEPSGGLEAIGVTETAGAPKAARAAEMPGAPKAAGAAETSGTPGAAGAE
jgi:glycosyltransferase involved in cell wall biosynthesis